jgi:hypothetical protein
MNDLYTEVRIKSGYYDEQLRIIRIQEVKKDIRILQAKKRKGTWWTAEDQKYLDENKKELRELESIPNKFNIQ